MLNTFLDIGYIRCACGYKDEGDCCEYGQVNSLIMIWGVSMNSYTYLSPLREGGLFTMAICLLDPYSGGIHGYGGFCGRVCLLQL